MNAVWDTQQVSALIPHCDLELCVKCDLSCTELLLVRVSVTATEMKLEKCMMYMCASMYDVYMCACDVYVCVHIHVCEYRSVHAKTHM